MKEIVKLPFLIALLWLAMSCGSREDAYIETVRGRIPVSKMGRTLIHEHLTTDFIGVERGTLADTGHIINLKTQSRYHIDSAVKIILPHLKKLRERGIQTLIECTPQFIGRDPRLLKKLSELSGLNIVTNTGYYAAANKKFLPAHVHTESAGQLAARWLSEIENGIEDTGIHPGFIKLGVGSARLDSAEEKLLIAAIAVHKKSGLTIAVHTGGSEAALSELEIIRREGLPGDAMICTHSQNAKTAEHLALAEYGVWLSFDGIDLESVQANAEFLTALKSKGYLSNVLISHDDGWSVEGEEGNIELKLFENGNKEPYSTIFDTFLDKLKQEGFSEAEIDTLLVINPAKAFGIREASK